LLKSPVASVKWVACLPRCDVAGAEQHPVFVRVDQGQVSGLPFAAADSEAGVSGNRLGRVCKAVMALDARRSWCAFVNSPMRSGS